MKILIVSLAAMLLAGVVYYLVAQGNSDLTEQGIVNPQHTTNENVVQPAPAKQIIFKPASQSEPGYTAAKTIMAEKLSGFEFSRAGRLLVTDTILVAKLFQASDAIVKGNFSLGSWFDVTLFDDQPCSFDSLLHPMTKAGTFWVLMARCQERSHKTRVRMILSPQNNQLYVSITDKGQPQAKSLHLTDDYVMAVDESIN